MCDRWDDLGRFSKPNALCPVCSANVFFYKSPFGGRVYFDELRPPWPKHPCTDDQPPAARTTAQVEDNAPSNLADLARHWRPLMCKSVRKGSGCTELAVAASDEVRILYSRVKEKVLDAEAPFFIRFVSKGVYEVSTLRAHEGIPSEIRFIAYRHFGDLIGDNRLKKKAELQPVRPVTMQRNATTTHLHLWYDEVSLSSVPVTYLNRRQQPKSGKKTSAQSNPRGNIRFKSPDGKRTKKPTVSVD
jgi:hypothetical protein